MIDIYTFRGQSYNYFLIYLQIFAKIFKFSCFFRIKTHFFCLEIAEKTRAYASFASMHFPHHVPRTSYLAPRKTPLQSATLAP